MGGRKARLDQFAGCGDGVGVERWATGLSAAFASSGNAVSGSFGDEATLEVGDGTEDMKDELSGGRGGIQAFLEAHEMDAAAVEIVNGFEQFSKGSAQAIEACDTKAITRAGVVNEFFEAGAFEAFSGDGVREDTNGTGFAKSVVLGVRVLICLGNASVTERIADSGSPGIGRF